MNVSVRVDSKVVIESCEKKIARIQQRRVELRNSKIERLMRKPGRFARFFGVKPKSFEEADALLKKEEIDGRCDWQIMYSVQVERCEVIAKMAKFECELVLDYDSFRTVGLAR